MDFTFRVGDRVRHVCEPNSLHIVENFAVGSANRVVVLNNGTRCHISNLRFACHHHNAPFTKETFDHARSYEEGVRDGRYWREQGRIYNAGGPYIYSLNRNQCCHLQEYADQTRLRHEAWLRGWKDGQSTMIDYSQPLRTTTGKPARHIAYDPKTNLTICAVGDVYFGFDKNGRGPVGCYQLENVPVEQRISARFRRTDLAPVTAADCYERDDYILNITMLAGKVHDVEQIQ